MISAVKDLPAVLQVLTVRAGGTQIRSRPYTVVTYYALNTLSLLYLNIGVFKIP